MTIWPSKAVLKLIEHSEFSLLFKRRADRETETDRYTGNRQTDRQGGKQAKRRVAQTERKPCKWQTGRQTDRRVGGKAK